MAKLTIEVPVEDLEKAIDGVYQKTKKKITLPGFRKGKAPRKLVEQMYGKDVFLEDAVNDVIPKAYSKAMAESGLEIVSQPSINITQVEHGTPLIFTAEVAVKPDVVLGQYKSIEVSKPELYVTEDEIDLELHKEQEKNARLIPVEDRAAQDGDIVTIDYEGFVDGKSYPEAKGENYALQLGSGVFIPGFEDQLVGVRAEESAEIHVTFPDNYSNEALRGKDATFQCQIHKVEQKELPDLDDEFAMDVSEFDTLEEYKEDIKKNLMSDKKETAKIEKGEEALGKIVGNSQMDIPEPMLEYQVSQLKNDMAARLQAQGMSLQQYLILNNKAMDDLDADLKEKATKNIQNRLVLEKIVEMEDIQPTQEQIDEELQRTADIYRMEAGKLKETIGDYEMEQVCKELAVQQALDLVVEASVEV